MVPREMPSSSCAKQKDVVPQARFQVALHLRQVEVWARAVADQVRARCERSNRPKSKSDAEIGLAVDQEMLLHQVPAARTHHQRRRRFAQFVALAFGTGVADRSVDRIAQIDLALEDVLQVGEFESSKSAMKTLAPEFSALMIILRSVGPGDLHAAVQQVGGNRRDLPVRPPDARRSPAGNRASRPRRSRCWRSRRLRAVAGAAVSNMRGQFHQEREWPPG